MGAKRWFRDSVAVAALVALVGGVSPSPGIAAPDRTLQTAIERAIEAQEGDYSVSVREIDGNPRRAEVDGHLRIEPASVIKLFYAWAALRERDAGRLDLDQPMDSGESWISCIRVMISVSDNGCAADIRGALGNVKLNTLFEESGFAGTRILLDQNGSYVGKTTTANDVTRLLVRLEGGTLLSPESTKYLHRLLLRQVWRTRLASGVPDGVVVENKSGEYWVGSGWTQSDAGIVRGADATYVITVFGRNDATKQGVAAISQAVYETLHGHTIQPATFPESQFTPIAPIAIRDKARGNIVGYLNAGDDVTVILSERSWVEIALPNNRRGWVTFSSLKLSKEYTWE